MINHVIWQKYVVGLDQHDLPLKFEVQGES